MNYIDLMIIIILVVFGIIGLFRGFFKSVIMFVGILIVFVLSYNLKNIVGDFLVLNMPFFNFPEFLSGGKLLNIILYQVIGFIIVFIILMIIYKIIVTITGIFEKILDITIILGLPSKILGFIFGIIEGYIFVFIGLFFLNQPFLNLTFIQESEYSKKILSNTPILTGVLENSLNVVNEIYDLKKIDDKSKIDLQMANIMLKDKFISPDILKKLIEKKKIDNINGIDNIIRMYEE